MSLAPYVRAMGRGPGRARSLERAEAEDAMAQILDGSAAPEAVGALFMLMRYRGESASEIAGFVTAMRAGLGEWRSLDAHLDWPSYAAGRSRGLPLFLLAARMVAQAGGRVVLHGWNSHLNPVADVRSALPAAGIAQAETPAAAAAALEREGIVYLPLETLDPRLLALCVCATCLGCGRRSTRPYGRSIPAPPAPRSKACFTPPTANCSRTPPKSWGRPGSRCSKVAAVNLNAIPPNPYFSTGSKTAPPLNAR